MKLRLILGIVLTVGCAIFVTITFWNPEAMRTMSLNEWGDFFAGTTAPLALLWLVIGYFQHGDELRLNTSALQEQKKEFRRQVKKTEVLARNAGRQAEATEDLARQDTEEREQEELRRIRGNTPHHLRSSGSARYNLREMYYDGEGVPQDYVEAYAWFSLAAAQGHDVAEEQRDLLPQSQIVAAEERSQELYDRINNSRNQ